ncbi:MAG: hypothetical protein LBB56_04155, partial [Chitinispirillales bacterium]|nr:hypothetical protein [Chitinispirillales bacterium]
MNLKRILSPVLGIGVVLGSLTGIVSPVSAQGSGAITIQNPYTGVDWGTWGQYKAANHTHSTYSDGSNKREDVLRDKYNKGFDIVAMTDHDVLTNKWDEAPEHNNPHPTTPTWRDNIGAGVLTSDALAAINAGTYYNSNFQGQYAGERTKTNGMIGMGGSNEWSAFNEPNITLTAGGTANFSGHHINTFFANLPQSAIADGSRTLANIIKGAQDLGGLAHINHPGRYTGGQTNEARSSDPDIVKAYVDLYTEYPSLVGMEIINKWDGESVNDRILWDNILMQTMPDRGVWGFTNDDSHSLSGNGHAWNVMLMPALTTDNTKTAMKDGAFYGVTRIERKYKINDEGTPGAPAQTTTTAAQYSGGDHNNMALGFLAQGALPSISNIVVDETAGTIVISAANSTNIDWVADGEVIYTGTSIDVNDYSTEINNYVRAVVVGPTGVAYTQPFGVASGKITLNPYDGVNWSTWGQYKAAHHMHSTYSDGSNRRRDQLIDMYNKDFDIVAMTDHDVLTEKWDEEPQHNNPHPTTSSWRDNIGAGVLTAAEAAAINGGTYQRGEYFQGQYLGRRVQTN